jgi:sugar lactone lactonase YvrE
VWVERDSALWFTDIKKRRIHRYDPAVDAGSSWDAPEQIGFVLPAASGGFVAGLQSGLHRFDPESASFTPLTPVEPERPGNRLNDGVVDPAGRLWFGSMDDGERGRNGSFFCFEGGKVRPSGISGIAITNGPAVSPDGRILYWVDTLDRTIWACDIHDDGTLGPSRAFARIDAKDGNPDGPAVDAQGHVWIGLYSGWEARRFSPEGEVSGRIRFPCANITKISFGGEDLRTVYATTARHLLPPEALAQQPQAGDLFAVRVDVPGLPSHLVAV